MQVLSILMLVRIVQAWIHKIWVVKILVYIVFVNLLGMVIVGLSPTQNIYCFSNPILVLQLIVFYSSNHYF